MQVEELQRKLPLGRQSSDFLPGISDFLTHVGLCNKKQIPAQARKQNVLIQVTENTKHGKPTMSIGMLAQ